MNPLYAVANRTDQRSCKPLLSNPTASKPPRQNTTRRAETRRDEEASIRMHLNQASTAKQRFDKTPCLVCGKKCKGHIATDDLIFCRTLPDGPAPAGYRYFGKSRDGVWGLYRENNWYPPPHDFDRPTNGTAKPPYKIQRREMTAADRKLWTERLGLPLWSFDNLPVWAGLDPYGQQVLAIAEVNGQGVTTGIAARRADGGKAMETGSRQGLYLPDGWERRPHHLYVAEGFSDTCTLDAAGLAVIGLHAAGQTLDHLLDVLASLPADWQITIVAENDQGIDEYGKPKWPGRDGAIRVATAIKQRLGREAAIRLPGGGIKDARAWFNAQQLPLDVVDAWHGAGERFEAGLQPLPAGEDEHAEDKPAQAEDRLYAVVRADAVTEETVLWDIPGYRVARAVNVVFALKGSGKTHTELDLMARKTRGWPMPPDATPQSERQPIAPPASCIYLCREDHRASIVVPRLRLAGADLSRVFFPKFNDLKFPSQPGRLLRMMKDNGVSFAVIDVLNSYVDRGVTEISNLDAREIIDCLTQVAEESQATIDVTKHPNKGERKWAPAPCREPVTG